MSFCLLYFPPESISEQYLTVGRVIYRSLYTESSAHGTTLRHDSSYYTIRMVMIAMFLKPLCEQSAKQPVLILTLSSALLVTN